MATLEELHDLLVAKVKHYNDLEIATGAIKSVRGGGVMMQGVNEAMFIAASISYGRSFKVSHGGSFKKSKGATQTKSSEFENEPGYDEEVHSHLIKMRDKVTAHSDHDANPVRISHMETPIETDIRQAPALGIMISILKMQQFETEQHRERILAHLAALKAAISRHIQTLTTEYLGIYNDEEHSIARGGDPKFEGHFVNYGTSESFLVEPDETLREETLNFPLSEEIKCQINSIRPGLIPFKVWRADGKSSTCTPPSEIEMGFSGRPGSQILISEI